MAQKVRLIWDFRGPDAKRIADHHVIHLIEFFQKENLEELPTGVIVQNEMLCSAFLETNSDEFRVLRDALKPHRGEYFE